MRFNITSKINLLIIIIIFATAASFNVLLGQVVIKKELKSIESHVMDISRLRGSHFIEHLRRGDLQEIFNEIALDIAALDNITDVKVYDSDGLLIIDRHGVKKEPFADSRMLKDIESKSMIHRWNGYKFTHFEPVTHGNGIAGFLFYEYDAEFLYRSFAELRKFSLIITGTLALFFIVVGLFFSETLNRRLTAIANAAKRVAAGDLSASVDVQSKDELESLAGNFNLMVEKLNSEITERRHAEEFIRNILQSVDEGFAVIDRDYRIVTANRAYCEQVKKSIEEITGKRCFEVSHMSETPCYEYGEDCPVKRTFETGEPHTAVHTHRDSEWNPVFIESKSYPLKDSEGNVNSAINILVDMTEKKKLEAQLCHAQKMESVGTLAGGIAHDFNNILTAIIGCAKLMEKKAGENESLSVYIEQINAAAEKAADLTKGLLAFSRKQSVDLKQVNLNDIVIKVGKLLLRLIGENIELRVKTAEDSLKVMADSNSIEQILMNLATNAKDAMPDGGVLSINLERAEIDMQYIKTHGYGRPGSYALITVSDTGAGMDDKTMERMFEPFFTTKDTGKGTGLGLSIVYGIVKQHNGYINVTSEPGNGTIFKIYIPVMEGEMKEADKSAGIKAPGGVETILFAEDEFETRKVIKAVLEEFGYKIIEAVNGEDAVGKFKESGSSINLLLFDITMPKKSGLEAFEEIAAEAPEVKAIFMSGYATDNIKIKKFVQEGVNFLQKPIFPEELLGMVRKVLDGSGTN